EIRDRTIKTMRRQRSQRKTSPIRTTRTLILLRTRTITCASTRHKPSSLRQHLANRGNQRHLAAKTNNKNLVMQQNGHPSPHCNEHAQAEHSTDHELRLYSEESHDLVNATKDQATSTTGLQARHTTDTSNNPVHKSQKDELERPSRPVS